MQTADCRLSARILLTTPPIHPTLNPTDCRANSTNGVPQVTTCHFSLSWGVGASTKWELWGFRGNVSTPAPTDLSTSKTKLFYAQE